MKPNPWHLTDGQVASMDAWIETGCLKRAADRLGVSRKTVSAQTCKARAKMQCRTLMLALVQWDRYRRGDRDCKWGVIV